MRTTTLALGITDAGPASCSGRGAGYVPALDGLRAVSILLVVVSHLGLDRVVPGAFGVTLFFFISGYLITRQLLGDLRKRGRLDLAGFYWRRALRLMPAGVVYIVVAGLVFQFAGGRISVAGWAGALLYGANYYDLWAGYHSTLAGVRHPFNILWSLAVEEHFYLLWPVMLLVLVRWRVAVPAVLVLCAAVLMWRLALLHMCFAPGSASAPSVCAPPNAHAVWRYNRLYLPTDTRLDCIAWGALLALRAGHLPAWRWRVMCGVALLAASFALTDPLGRYGLRPFMQGVGLLALVPWLLQPGHLVHRVLCWKASVWVGRLSYSLYLWHWGALGVADYLAGRDFALWLAIAVPLSVALACASYWGIERPMLRVRRRFGSHAPLGVAGHVTDMAKGVPHATA